MIEKVRRKICNGCKFFFVKQLADELKLGKDTIVDVLTVDLNERQEEDLKNGKYVCVIR